MNYLAHLLLAEKNPESIIGNFLGDFVKGTLDKAENHYTANIIKGIKTHRKVDCFTDRHEIYRRSKHRISLGRRRFAGIIIDVCYDHFLARNWSLFSDAPLANFVNYIYSILEQNQEILPDKLQNILPRIISENWLESYQEISSIDLTFARISKRLTRKNNLANAIEEMTENYQEIELDFLAFFPELIDYVTNDCQD